MFEQVTHTTGLVIEAFGVFVIVVGLLYASARFLRQPRAQHAFRNYRNGIGHSLLLGLELLVAADIIETVTTVPTLESVLALAVIVLIRTFLSVSINVEVEGRLPWRR